MTKMYNKKLKMSARNLRSNITDAEQMLFTGCAVKNSKIAVL